MIFLLGVSSGCYAYVPTVSSPAPGTELRLELNDRGRVGMAESVGASAENVETILTADQDSAYAVRVVSVSYRNGQFNKWNNEPLVISKQFVGSIAERKFSSSRTFVAVAAVAAGVVLILAGKGLVGRGTPDHDTKDGGGNTSFR